MSEPGGSSGPSGQPPGNKRPGALPANETNSSKKPKTFPVPAPTALGTQKPGPPFFFGKTTSLGASDSINFGGAANYEVPNTTLQPSWSLANTANQTTLGEILQHSVNTKEIVQTLVNESVKTKEVVHDLTEEISTLKKEVEYIKKTLDSSRAPPVLASQSDHLIHAKGYLDWLKKLDLRPPDGIMNWLKAETTFSTLPLVTFDHRALFVVLKGDLRTAPDINASLNREEDAEWGFTYFQKQYTNECYELDRQTDDSVPRGFPTFLLPLGEVFIRDWSRENKWETRSLNADLCIDISTPSKSLWIVASPMGTKTPKIELVHADGLWLSFNVVQLVEDIRKLKFDTTMSTDEYWFMLQNSKKVMKTMEKSACTEEYTLRTPTALQLEQAIFEGWAKEKGPLFS
ncbi:hypothetical protein PG995_002867 [Apiospora arundinis]